LNICFWQWCHCKPSFIFLFFGFQLLLVHFFGLMHFTKKFDNSF
uniref:Ovule protein n=1 Tax=Brugia timori TaxID=42155 RepID=A0A0R3Q8H3_9BILA